MRERTGLVTEIPALLWEIKNGRNEKFMSPKEGSLHRHPADGIAEPAGGWRDGNACTTPCLRGILPPAYTGRSGRDWCRNPANHGDLAAPEFRAHRRNRHP